MNGEAVRKRIQELRKPGIHCSQVMMIMCQDLRGEEEPAVISAMGGLGGGMYSGLNCGTLTGAACILSAYCALGGLDETDKFDYTDMVAQLVEWFKSEFGSVNCSELVGPNPSDRAAVCPGLMEKTFIKTVQILEENGIDPRE